MRYKLIKKLKRMSGGYRKIGAFLKLDEAQAAKLMASGHIANPAKLKAKEKSEANINIKKVEKDGDN